MEFSYFMPVRLLFGANVIDQLGATAKSYGTHALIVTGRSSTKRSGLLDRSIALLEAAGVRATVFNKVEPNPLTTTVMEGAALAVSWEKVPTKRERWLMIVMEDKQQMFFSGRDTPAAFVNFKIHGDYDIGPKNCEMLSEEFMNDLSQVLGIQKERIFVAHDVCPSWGWVDDPDPRAYGPAPV